MWNIIEEEVLLHKDIHHDGSTRRTITRFMAAILIAVSIESLLLMFKSLLGESGQLQNAVWMLLAAGGSGNLSEIEQKLSLPPAPPT